MNNSKQPAKSTRPPTQIIMLLSAGLIALNSSNLYAIDKEQSAHWDVGINTSFIQSPFIDGKGRIGLSPARLKHGNLRLRGFAWPLYRNAGFTPYFGIGLDEWDNERGDSSTLRDMDELKRAINLRAGVATSIPSGQLSAELSKELAGAHKGLQAKVRYSRHIELADAEIRPYVEAQWLSAELTDYYVGVDSNEVKQNRAQYEADADMALKAGVNYRQRLSEAFTLTGGINLTHYGSEISDSPIIENELIWGANLGLTYRWK